MGEGVIDAMELKSTLHCGIKEAVAIIRLYQTLERGNHKSRSIADIKQDFERETLYFRRANNGRDVIHYMNDRSEAAVYIDNAEVLSAREIYKEL